jgi:hypothetical protein
MTTATWVAVSELTRELPWALRALGFSYGVAERGADLLARAEALRRGGLATLRKHEPALIEGVGRGYAKTDIAPGIWEVETRGKSLIEMGPPAIDLAASVADSLGFGHARLTGLVDTELIGPVLTLASVYRLAAVGLCLESQSGVDVQRWAAALPTTAGTLLFESSSRDALRARASKWKLESRLVDAILAAWDGHRRSAAGILDIFVARAVGISGEEPAAPEGVAVINVTDAIANAYRSGIASTSEDVAYLYALERRTWAPSSERSRAQAGFQQKPATH